MFTSATGQLILSHIEVARRRFRIARFKGGDDAHVFADGAEQQAG
jgi:hypothetical protein